jgi:hypothetical protein
LKVKKKAPWGNRAKLKTQHNRRRKEMVYDPYSKDFKKCKVLPVHNIIIDENIDTKPPDNSGVAE